MNYLRSTITHSTTGVKTWTVGFQAKEVELVVTPAPGSTISDPRWSVGVTDGTNQVCDHVAVYPSNRRQERYTDRMASVWEYNGGTGTWTEVFKATFDSITSTEVKYNVVTASANYQVHRKARA